MANDLIIKENSYVLQLLYKTTLEQQIEAFEVCYIPIEWQRFYLDGQGHQEELLNNILEQPRTER